MKKLYRLLLLAILMTGVGFNAKAEYVILKSSNWAASVISTTKDGVVTGVHDWWDANDAPNSDWNDNPSSAKGEGLMINIKKGFKAVVTHSNLGEMQPEATPYSDFGYSYIIDPAVHGTKLYSDAPTIDIQISEDTGDDQPGDEPSDNAWPAQGYGFDVTWNIPGSVTLKKGSANVSLDADATYYLCWDEEAESEWEIPTLKVYANDGYKFGKVYYIDEDNNEVKINTYYAYYNLNSNVSKQHVFVEMIEDKPDSKFALTFVNTPECFQSLTLTDSNKEIKNLSFEKGVATDIEFSSASDSKAEIWFNTQTWQLDSDGDKLWRQVYKLTKNGDDITADALRDNWGTYYYEVSIADGDKFEVQPFEVDPNKATYAVTIDAPEGVIASIFNRTTSKIIELTDNRIEVLEGTVLQFNFNDDITLNSVTYAGENLEGWDNGGGRLTVTATGTLKIDAIAKVYNTLTFTAYISNAEGVTVYEGNMNGRVLELGEGETIAADIELPAVSGAGAAAWSMSASDTRKYTFTISDKYDRVLVTQKSGYWLRTIRGANTSSADACNLKSITDKTFYVAAEKVENDSKAIIYLAGNPDDIAIRASRLNEAEITHKITGAGYTEFEFDADYESPFDLTGISVSEAGIYVGGKASANVNVYLDNAIQSPDENGAYSAIAVKNGSVLKIFADGKLYKQQQVYVDAAEGTSAEVIYDRTFAHTDFASAFKCHEGTEIAIKPGENTTVAINHIDEDGEVVNTEAFTPDENGVCTYVVPAYSNAVAKHVVALAYDNTPVVNEYVLTPASGSTLTEKPEKITVAFPNATSVTVVGGNDEIYLKKGWAVALTPTAVTVVEGAECPTVDIEFSTDYMPNGSYSLLIPEGFFSINGDATNDDITATYNVKAPLADLSYTVDPYTGKVLLGEDGIHCGIIFNSDEAVVSVADKSKIKVSYNGNVIESGVRSYGQENMLLIDVDAENIGLGTLDLEMEAGALSISGTESPAISASWQIVAPKEYTCVITPADGAKLSEISSVTIAFEGAEEAEVFIEHGIDLFDNSYNYYQSGKITAVEGTEVPTFIVEFETPATEPGEYTFRVFGGTFTLDGVSSSDAIEATYYIAGPMSVYVVDPADESEVESLAQITISFPNAQSVEIDEEGAVMMRNAMWSYYGYAEVAAVEGADVPTFTLSFEEAPTAGGEYYVTIPEGFFTSGNEACEDIYLTYTLMGAEVDYTWFAMPDEGDIDIDSDPFYAESVTVGFMFADEALNVEFADPVLEVYNNDTELIPFDDFEVEAMYNFISFTIPADKLVGGALTIKLGAGSLAINGEMFYEDMEHTWTIKKDASGINDITVESANGDIYNLRGVKLNSDFDKLPTGVYIVGGRKVLKK